MPKTVYNSNNDDDDDNNKDIIILLCDWRSPLGWPGRELYKSLFVGRGKELGVRSGNSRSQWNVRTSYCLVLWCYITTMTTIYIWLQLSYIYNIRPYRNYYASDKRTFTPLPFQSKCRQTFGVKKLLYTIIHRNRTKYSHWKHLTDWSFSKYNLVSSCWMPNIIPLSISILCI